MFVAYCKNVPVGTIIQDIQFSERKQQFVNCMVLLERSERGAQWYFITETKCLLHEDWLENIQPIESVRMTAIHVKHETVMRITSLKGFDQVIKSTLPNIMDSYVLTELIANESVKYIKDWLLSKPIGKEYLKKCEKCGGYFFQQKDDHTLCISCFEKMTKKCFVCGKRFVATDKNKFVYAKTNKEEHVCFNCSDQIKKCKTCGKTFVLKNSEGQFIENGFYCHDCFKVEQTKAPLKKCGCCGHIFAANSTDIKYSSVRKSYICNVCMFDKRTQNMGESIRPYNFKPTPIFFGNNMADNLFFGVEMEILTPINKNAISKYMSFLVNEEEEFIYTKFDRSIGMDGDGGFEIVTHPFNYLWLKSEEGLSKIKRIFQFNKYRCEAFDSNTCGMHVHLSKDAFDYTHMFKFMSMIYNNKEFSLKISEREDLKKVETYSSFTPIKDLKQLAKDRTNNNDGTSRHKAINLSCPNTLEVRIFRGTFEFERFMKNVEFCKSLFDFTKDCPIQDISVDNYKKFVRNNYKNYNYLYLFLKQIKEI